jgi:hypothetical protein
MSIEKIKEEKEMYEGVLQEINIWTKFTNLKLASGTCNYKESKRLGELLIKLNSIKEYTQKQLESLKNDTNDNQELDINKWAEELRAKNQISTRLYNFLTNPKYFKNINLKTLDKYEFIKYRGCGVHYWDEFVKLRGY